METYIDSREFQEMKQQISLLKEKLNRQTIVSDNFIRKTMKHHVSTINRHAVITILICVGFTPFCIGVLGRMGFSVWFLVATGCMMLFCALHTYFYHRKLWNVGFMNEDLLTIARVMSTLRKRYADWLQVAIPMLLTWFAWLLIEGIIHLDTELYLMSFLPGTFVGLVIGGIIGNKRRKRVIRQAEGVLTAVDELLQKGS